MNESPYRTWGRHRASPLRLDHYPARHPIHVTIRSHGGKRVFARPRLASLVFRILRSHERTLAAVLMPDHLHWVLDCAERAPRAIADFKSLSTRLAWERDVRGRLWQRSYFDQVARDPDGLARTIRYVLANPIRSGLASDAADYPWAYDRFGLGSRAAEGRGERIEAAGCGSEARAPEAPRSGPSGPR